MDIASARERLEAIGLGTDAIDEVLPLVIEQKPASGGLSALEKERQALTEALPLQTDWRTRAAMAARIISINLEA